MAKGSSPFSVMVGKLGSVVLYRNSQSKQKQGAREYVANPKNPRSYGQARQRLVLRAVQNLYRALSAVIDRGYESLAYGNASRLKFLKDAMTNFQGPWLTKGSNFAIPFNVNIAEGSIYSVSVSPRSNVESTNWLTNIPLSRNGVAGTITPQQMTEAFDGGEIAGISKALLNGSIVKNGDQITIVEFVPAGTNIMPRVHSFIVDTQSEATIAGFGLNFAGEDQLTLQFNSRADYATAVAVIISRDGENGKHLRSLSQLTINPEDPTAKVYFSDDAYQMAIASYMDEGGMSDWPVEPEGTEINDVKSYVKFDLPASAIQLVPTTGGEAIAPPASITSVNVQGYRTSGNALGLFVDQNGYAVGSYNGSGVPVTKLVTSGNVTYYVKYVSGANVTFVTKVG